MSRQSELLGSFVQLSQSLALAMELQKSRILSIL